MPKIFQKKVYSCEDCPDCYYTKVSTETLLDSIGYICQPHDRQDAGYEEREIEDVTDIPEWCPLQEANHVL